MQFRLTSVEGNRQKLDGGAMFGHAPKALWERWAPPDAHNRVELACRALLVEEVPTASEGEGAAGRRILLETGIGAFLPPELKERYGVVEDRHVLLDNLAALGLSHEDIDIIVLSHLHFDHAGGLLSAWEPIDEPGPQAGSQRRGRPPELLFPNARILVSRAAWERARNPHDRDRASFIPELQPLLERSGRLVIIEHPGRRRAGVLTHELLGPAWRLHLSWGHTPGMMLAELAGRYGPVVFGGDLVPGRPWVHRSIHMGYDRYPELLLDEKVALLDDLVARKGRLFFTHDPHTAMARITRDERGRYGSTSDRARLDRLLA